MELKKPEGFVYLNTLNPEYNSLEILKKLYKTEETANDEKIKELKNPFSLSGSKAKQLVENPYARYKEVILGESPYFGEEAETRMLMGKILEDSIIYHLIKPKYENNPLWADKVIVIDKRRRQVKGMPWISYELDMIVYKLDSPRSEYVDGFPTEINYSNSIYYPNNETLYQPKLPCDFVINNTSGAYDEFLETQEKYAIYDVKNSQLDVMENFDNYDNQINVYGYFENTPRVGLFVLVKNAKLEELVKDKDARIIKKIFNSYDNFIKGLENGYTFEKEKFEGICTELPVEADTQDNQKILDNIYEGLKLFKKYDLEYKTAEANLKLIKDYIKVNLPTVTKQEKFNITIPLNSDETEKLSYYTTKVSTKEEINTKELIKFFFNNDITKVKTKNGEEIDFSLQKFMYQKWTGGIGMFRLTTKEQIYLDSYLEIIFKGEKYDI